jgi:hypothetical protein
MDDGPPEKHLARLVAEVIDGLDPRATIGACRGSGSARAIGVPTFDILKPSRRQYPLPAPKRSALRRIAVGPNFFQTEIQPFTIVIFLDRGL